MISEEFKPAIVADGIRFLRTITEAYGTEDGMALWEQMSGVLDSDVKGAMFFAMITGNYSTKLTLSLREGQPRSAIVLIKAIRTATNLGLKEAKDLYDLMNSGSSVSIEVGPDRIDSAKAELSRAGAFIL